MLVASTFLLNSAFNFALGLLVARFLGPLGFGQYAIAAAIAVVLNTLFLDWIRIAATRYYSKASRADDPSVRGTLDAVFALSSVGVVATCAVSILLGLDFGLAITLAAFAPALAICNGLYDYHTALARALFQERTYSLLVVVKNVLSLGLMTAGAWWLQSPAAVAAGLVLSLLVALLTARRRLSDANVDVLRPDWAFARRAFGYGFPVIFAAMIYFTIPLWNRTAIASSQGFAQSGQFSLAYDLVIRVVQTVGSALDIVLFQLAVRAEAEGGLERAREQLARNMGVVLAAVAAVAVGYWLVLPSFEALLVPEAFRGQFLTLTTILLPGIALFTLVQAAITPVMQLRQKTWPVVAAALAGLGVNAAATSALGPDAGLAAYAAIQTSSYAVAFLFAALLAFRSLPVLPSLWDAVGVAAAALLMAAAVWPVRLWGPGWLTLVASVAVGAAVFATVLLAANVAGCRDLIVRRLRRSP